MIIGQDRAVEMFEAARSGGSLHHAWLLAGPKGVGKALFAELAAKRILADAAGPRTGLPDWSTAADHPIARLVDAGSHPDHRRIERLENAKGDGLARNISVKQVRDLGSLFTSAPAMSSWRTVIIDSIDDLEASAANALLKMLEEPPANCLFLLVSHVPGRLLPTIRSRCRRLSFSALERDAMTSVLRRSLPDVSAVELERLVALGSGCPGRALAYAGLDLAALEEEVTAILRTGDSDNVRRLRLSQAVAGKAAAPRFAAFLDIAPTLIAREARAFDGEVRSRALDAYQSVREISASALRLSLDPAATAFRIGGILASVQRQEPALP